MDGRARLISPSLLRSRPAWLTIIPMNQLRLFHASENAGIKQFVPRAIPSPSTGVTGEAVWAIDETHLPNYLLPRDCPRVTFCSAASTSSHDQERFFSVGSSRRIVAVESTWLKRIQETQLYLYELPTPDFELIDANAGYFISRKPVKPLAEMKISNLLSELLKQDVELRFLPELQSLRAAVVNSTLEYSIIRFPAAPLPKKL
jgi:hypothetical protein